MYLDVFEGSDDWDPKPPRRLCDELGHVALGLTCFGLFGLSLASPFALVSGIHSLTEDNSITEKLQKLDIEVTNLSPGSCFYIDPERRLQITASEYKHGAFADGLLFAEAPRIEHELGTLPIFETAPCKILAEGEKLSEPDARHKASEAVSRLMNSNSVKNLTPNMQGQLQTKVVSFKPV